jgi:4-hydroxybenzoate polyprenyltransferase
VTTNPPPSPAPPRATARAVGELVRLPNLFTAAADSLAGFLYIGGRADQAGVLACLMTASVCLYAGGVALNDVCDAPSDAGERPGRPIPSGRITRRAAAILSAGLLAMGVAAAAVVSPLAAVVAGGVVAAIVLYDAVLKRTFLAPAMMGLCRALNLTLGTTAAAWSAGHSPLLPAGLMWLYVASLTFFARKETGGGSRRRLHLGLTGVATATACLFLTVPGALSGGLAKVLPPFVLMGLLVGTTLPLIEAPRPATIQRAVRNMIFGLVLFDACLVMITRGAGPALLVASLLIPTVWLGRRFAAT